MQEQYYHEEDSHSVDPVPCHVGHCRSNFWCNKVRLVQVNSRLTPDFHT